jgi:hypothetical protein
MNITIVKEATQYTPAELFGLSSALGAGSFGAIQLLRDLSEGGQGTDVPENLKPLNIEVPLLTPAEHAKKKQEEEEKRKKATLLKQMAEQHIAAAPQPLGQKVAAETQAPAPLPEEDSVFSGIAHRLNTPVNNVSSFLIGASGLPVGFMGTKMVYDKLKADSLDAEIERKKKRYMDMLEKVKYGEASLPYVSAFCAKWATALNEQEKQAVDKIDEARERYTEHPVTTATNIWNRLTGNSADQAADILKVIGVGTGLATLGTLVYKSQNKKKKEQNAVYPRNVTLTPV